MSCVCRRIGTAKLAAANAIARRSAAKVSSAPSLTITSVSYMRVRQFTNGGPKTERHWSLELHPRMVVKRGGREREREMEREKEI